MCSAIVASALVFAGNRLIKRSNPLWIFNTERIAQTVMIL
jgi:hypothetical protein